MSGVLRTALRVLEDWRAWSLAIVAVVVLATLDARNVWLAPAGHGAAVIELMAYWGTWLLWPAAVVTLWHAIAHAVRRRPWRTLRSLLALAICSLLIWGRFVEPNLLRVTETDLDVGCGVRVALVSDLHVGLFMRDGRLDELVERLNGLDVDAVLIAGDWTYQPQHDLRRAFAPIAGLRLRPYAVLGNHDEGVSGNEAITQPLRAALGSLGVRLIDGQQVPLGRCTLVGLGDYLAGSAARDLVPMLQRAATERSARPRVVLVHEPQAVWLLPRGFAVATLAGHTHGGQINLPWITRRLLRYAFAGGWIDGLYDLKQTRLFVTTGIGTDHIPLRINMPPTIDVLSL